MLRHITDAASSCSLCFFWLFWRCVGCEWKLELHNVNQVKLQMWHQSTLSTMRPGFNTSTTPTPPTILRWQYFLKSWVLFFSKIVHHFLLKANLIFLRSSGQSGDLVTEVVSTNIMGIFFVQNHVYNLPFDEPSQFRTKLRPILNHDDFGRF